MLKLCDLEFTVGVEVAETSQNSHRHALQRDVRGIHEDPTTIVTISLGTRVT